MSESFERRVEASAAFDKRHPDPHKDYGISSVRFRFSLIGERAAASFYLLTGWLLPETLGVSTERAYEYQRALAVRDQGLHPAPAGLFFHLAEPTYDYMSERGPQWCDLLPGEQCYGDVTYIGADRPFFALIERGLEGLWEQLSVELGVFTSRDEDPS